VEHFLELHSYLMYSYTDKYTRGYILFATLLLHKCSLTSRGQASEIPRQRLEPAQEDRKRRMCKMISNPVNSMSF
jgi:hypothetical protein